MNALATGSKTHWKLNVGLTSLWGRKLLQLAANIVALVWNKTEKHKELCEVLGNRLWVMHYCLEPTAVGDA